MRILVLATAFALAATAAHAGPGFAGAQLSSSKGQKRQECETGSAVGAAGKFVAFFAGLTQVTAKPAPRLPDERPLRQKNAEGKEDPAADAEKPADDKHKPIAPSEPFFFAF